MEFGARALGNRSILATPLDPNMTTKLNAIIKKREGFRPFAPSIVEEEADKYFDMKEPSPYMSLVVPVKNKKLKAITHVNDTARVQTVNKKFNPRYYKLLKQMKAVSGHPVVLNTSFNLKDQVITMEPERALQRFLSSEMDALVIDNYLILKR
jgi:carbamoyltransferase